MGFRGQTEQAKTASVGFDGVRFRYQQRRASAKGVRKEMGERLVLALIWVVPQECFLPRTVGAGFLFFRRLSHRYCRDRFANI
jgi:hypothetical protein